MMICTVCGKAIPAGMVFCPNCGSRVPESALTTEPAKVKREDTVCVNVREAEVYYDGARVHTAGTVTLKKGANRIWFRNLSAHMESGTVQLKVSGLVSRFMEPAEALIVEDAETAEKKEALKREIKVLELQEELLKKNGDFTARQNMPTEEIVQYLRELPGLLMEIDQQIAEKNAELEQIQKNCKSTKEKMLEAEVECEEEGSYPFVLTYVTKDADWTPFYDIYADEEESILIQLKGRLCQKTACDWEDCQITLVSGIVNRSGNLPVLRPKYYYGAVRPQTVKTPSGASGMSMMMKAMPSAAPMAMMAESSGETAFADTLVDTLEMFNADILTGNVVRYVLPGTWHISSSEKGAVLNIHSFQAEGSFRYESVPMLDDTAYLVAEITDFRNLHLMECKANVFLQGNYVGETRIPDVSEDTMVLSLGRDERIEVTRTEKKADHTAAFLKNTQTRSFEYLLTVCNRSEDTVDVRLYDQVPISRTQEIKVETGNLSGGKMDENDGKVTWNLNLKPGEKKELTLSYSVTWPKDSVLR